MTENSFRERERERNWGGRDRALAFDNGLGGELEDRERESRKVKGRETLFQREG